MCFNCMRILVTSIDVLTEMVVCHFLLPKAAPEESPPISEPPVTETPSEPTGNQVFTSSMTIVVSFVIS